MKKLVSLLLTFVILVSVMPQVHVANAEVIKQQSTISSGVNHSAAIKSDGSLWTWGWNHSGQLGHDGSSDEVFPPSKIMDDVIAVSLGNWHSAAIKSDGSLWVWGQSTHGQLGNGSTIDSFIPVKIMDSAVAVSLGSGHSAAIKSDGSLWTWGWNHAGQLGDGSDNNSYTPTKIMDDVIGVSLGDYHSAAIKSDGSLWTWGKNEYGQLGNGSTIDSFIPVKIMDDVIGVSLGSGHSAAIKSDGSLWTWGWNYAGQLGDGSNNNSYTPTKIMDDVIAVSLRDHRSAAIKNDGSLWAWGSNYGQFSDNDYTPVKRMDNVVAVSLEAGSMVAIKNDGSLCEFVSYEFVRDIILSENSVVYVPEQPNEASHCVISDEYLSLKKTEKKGNFICNFIFTCEGNAENLRIHFETDDCVDWDMSQHPVDFASVDYTGDVIKDELVSGRYDSDLEMYCINLAQGVQCNNPHKVKMIISGDNFVTVEAEDRIELNYVKRINEEEFMLSKLKLAGLSRKITNEIFTKQTMFDSKLDEVKKYIKTQVNDADTSVPDEIYEAFANAILNKITDDSIDIKELDTNMNEMTKQIYKQLKSGISSIDEDVVIDGQMYNVSGLICAVSWGKLVGVSWANVDYKGRTINLMWNSSGWTPKEFAENSNKSIAAFGGVVAQLNSELWKDFMAYYVVDGAQVMGIKIRKENVDKVLDITEKVIRAVCGDKEDANNLVSVLGDTAKETLKNGLIKGNGVKAFINSEYDNGKAIIQRAEEYLKLKEEFVKFEEKFRFSNSSDELLRDYENIKKLLNELERGINQDFTLGSDGRVYFASNNIKVSNSLGNTLFEMEDGNVLTSTCEFEPCYEDVFEGEKELYGSIDTGTTQFTIETSDNYVVIIGNGTINTIEMNGNVIVNANQSEKQYEIEAVDDNSIIKILTQNISEDEIFSKKIAGGLDSNDTLHIYYDENEPVIVADTEKLFDVIIKTADGEVQKANVRLEPLNASDEGQNDGTSQLQPASKFQCSDWAQLEVTEAYEKDLIPESLIVQDLTQTISRAEFADLAVTLYEKMSGKKAQMGENSFDDIESHALKNEILKAYDLGITTGTNDNNFEPNLNITREQLATMLCRAIKKVKFEDWDISKDFMHILKNTGQSFFIDDNNISKYAKNSVYFMADNKIVTGTGNNRFEPLNVATKEQAILISLRCFKEYADKTPKIFEWEFCRKYDDGVIIYDVNADNTSLIYYDAYGNLLNYIDIETYIDKNGFIDDILIGKTEYGNTYSWDVNVLGDKLGWFYPDGASYLTDLDLLNNKKIYNYYKLISGKIVTVKDLGYNRNVWFEPCNNVSFAEREFYDSQGLGLLTDKEKGLIYSNGTVYASISDIEANYLLYYDYYDATNNYFSDTINSKVILYHANGNITDDKNQKLNWIDEIGYCYLDGTVYISAMEYYEFKENNYLGTSYNISLKYYDDFEHIVSFEDFIGVEPYSVNDYGEINQRIMYYDASNIGISKVEDYINILEQEGYKLWFDNDDGHQVQYQLSNFSDNTYNDIMIEYRYEEQVVVISIRLDMSW